MLKAVTSLFFCAFLLAPTARCETAPAGVRALIDSAEASARLGDYDAALPRYESAISALAAEPRRQQELRYRYGMVLTALAKRHRPDLHPLARAQFQAVLDYLDSGAPLRYSAAQVSSALAHSYHQQAASADQAARRSHLLRNAYRLYRGAIGGLTRQQQWHNLAITYFNLGQVCEWQGNLEEAITWVEKAVELDRSHGFADLEEDIDYLLALRQRAYPDTKTATSAL
ncbi:tetratricopeptide repeat protein [Microbulbifer sp. 2201CG32-9]|uniref:tetratricopeptide repeat protein n=1 Tax=Microbulbifer sp. 2201CG32-9 TaxID=3232309 RepID=UPI00345B67A3